MIFYIGISYSFVVSTKEYHIKKTVRINLFIIVDFIAQSIMILKKFELMYKLFK